MFAIYASCPQCGCPLTLIAAIEDPTVIAKILAHLSLPTRAPSRTPARLEISFKRSNTYGFKRFYPTLDFGAGSVPPLPLAYFPIPNASRGCLLGKIIGTRAGQALLAG